MSEDKITAARQDMSDAETALHSALVRVRSAAQRLAVQELLACPKESRANMALSYIRSNKAEWSGGPDSAANILERAQAQAYLYAIQVAQNRP